MANVLVNEQTLKGIADSLRRNGVDRQFKPSEMPKGIDDVFAMGDDNGYHRGHMVGYNSGKQDGYTEGMNDFAIKPTVSGESIVVNDSIEYPPLAMTVFGKSWQNRYDGNQLFKKIKSAGLGESVSEDGLTATCKAQTNASYPNLFSLYHDIIPVVSGTTYYISADIKLDSGTLNMVNSIKLMSRDGNTTGSATVLKRPTINSTYKRYIFSFVATQDFDAERIYVQGYIADNAVCTITNIMVSTVNTEYESYVGGVPSPNKDYPQEMHCHGENGSIEYSLHGGNFIPPTTKSSKTTNGITFDVLEDGWVHVHGTATANAIFDYIGSWKGKNDVVIPKGFAIGLSGNSSRINVICYGNRGSDTGSFNYRVAEEDLYNTYIYLEVLSGGTVDYTVRPYACLDGKLTDYKEPQSLILQTPNGLKGLTVLKSEEANYTDSNGKMWACDYIDLKRGKRVQRIIEAVLDGSKFIGSFGGTWYITSKTLFGYDILHHTDALYKQCIHDYVMSDTFSFQSFDYANTWGGTLGTALMYFAKRDTTNQLTLPISLFETQDANGFKKFFSEHPTKIWAILAEPIERDLTEEEMSQYNALMMNESSTTILNDSNAHTSVHYIADTNAYLNNLTNAILTVGGNV